MGVLFDFREKSVRIKAIVVDATSEKTKETLDVGSVIGARGYVGGRFVFFCAVRSDMAHRTVVCNARESDHFLGEADGHFVALFPRDSQGAITSWSREIFGEDARQHHPNPVRNACGS